MNYKAVIFTVEDCVVDMQELYLLSLNHVLSSYHIHISKKRWEEDFRNEPLLDVLSTIITENSLSITPSKLLKTLYSELSTSLKDFSLEPRKGFYDFISYLVDKRIKVFFLFESQKPFSNLIAKSLSISKYPSVFSSDVNLQKPDPSIYEYILSKHSLKPSEVLAFDYSLPGVVAANALGIDVIAVPRLNSTLLKSVALKDSFSTFHEINFPSLVELSLAPSDN